MTRVEIVPLHCGARRVAGWPFAPVVPAHTPAICLRYERSIRPAGRTVSGHPTATPAVGASGKPGDGRVSMAAA